MRLNVYFDGGCCPNPGPAYGSFEAVEEDGGYHLRAERFDLGVRTNNEAEYLSLVRAINDLTFDLCQKGIERKTVSLKIFSDSKYLVARVSGRKKKENPKYMKTPHDIERANRMRNLAEQCIRLLAAYAWFQIEWRPRETNVERFGH